MLGMASFRPDVNKLIEGLKIQLSVSQHGISAPQKSVSDSKPGEIKAHEIKARQIRPGVLAVVGAVAAVLSRIVYLLFFGLFVNNAVPLTYYTTNSSYLISLIASGLCGALAGLLTPRHGLLTAVGISTIVLLITAAAITGLSGGYLTRLFTLPYFYFVSVMYVLSVFGALWLCVRQSQKLPAPPRK